MPILNNPLKIKVGSMKQLKILVLMTVFSFSNFLFSSGGGGAAAARDLSEIHELPEFKKNNLIFVGMNEYGVVTAASREYFRIATCGAATCFIVVVVDNSKKIALIAHVAANTKLESLVEKIKEFNPTTSTIFLRGGNVGVDNNPEYQKKRRNSVLRALLSTDIRINYEPKEQAAEDRAFGASFHLNMRTGEVDEVFHGIGFFQFSPKTVKKYKGILLRKVEGLLGSQGQNSTDLSCVFDGRKKQ
jgi:hypothetical protein